MSFQDGKLQSGSLEGHKCLKLVPLVIRWAAGVPSLAQNPMNESITVADTGTGIVTLTFADAALAPMIVGGLACLSSAPATLGNLLSLHSAPTASVVALVIQDGSDAATEVDPVDVHLCVYKLVQA